MTMKLLHSNELNTTTQVVVDSPNTLTVAYAFDIDLKKQWETVGYDQGTSTIFSVEFGTNTVIDKMFLQNHNFKKFRIFYNSVTGNTFSPNIAPEFNSDTSTFFDIATKTVSSIQLQIDTTIDSGVEKAMGYFYIGSDLLDFERNPNTADYKPTRPRKQIVHNMPNGGVSIFNVQEKFQAEIKWKFVTESFKDDLYAIWDTGTTFFFVPFPSSSFTSWDGDAFEVAWIGKFDFRHSDNNIDAGYTGRIILREVA